MTLFIDADGCPVTDLAVRLSQEYGVPVTILCDTSHEIHRNDAETIIVSKGADSVDFKLINLVQPGDIVITQDYGLAAMALARRARPLHQNGFPYTADNIDALLLARHTARKIRNSGGRTKGPAKRTAQDDRAFAASLRTLLEEGRQ